MKEYTSAFLARPPDPTDWITAEPGGDITAVAIAKNLSSG